MGLASWWEIFEDAHLDRIVAEAVAANADLAQAEARLRQARAGLRVARSGAWPRVDATISGARGRALGGADDADLYDAGFDASFEIDLWGGVRRRREAAAARSQAANYDLRTAALAVVADVARAYIDFRAAEARLAVARDNLAAQQETAALTMIRFELGAVARSDVVRAASAVELTAAAIHVIEIERVRALLRIAVLTGREPSARATIESGPQPRAQMDDAITIPARLLSDRPDVAAAEARLRAETADVGVAEAARLPRLALDGAVGVLSSTTSGVNWRRNGTWSLGGSILTPIFAAGRLRAERDAEAAEAEGALAAYQGVALAALEDAESALAGYAETTQRRARLSTAADLAATAADLMRELYRGGEADFIDLLDAERRRLDAQDALAQAEADVATRLIAVFKAFGGGWDGRELRA